MLRQRSDRSAFPAGGELAFEPFSALWTVPRLGLRRPRVGTLVIRCSNAAGLIEVRIVDHPHRRIGISSHRDEAAQGE